MVILKEVGQTVVLRAGILANVQRDSQSIAEAGTKLLVLERKTEEKGGYHIPSFMGTTKTSGERGLGFWI